MLSKALCGSVAAAGLAQIRKYAATQEGKALHNTTGIQKWKLFIFLLSLIIVVEVIVVVLVEIAGIVYIYIA